MIQPGRQDAPCCGVLLVNLGTPTAPTAGDVRRYLAEFLHDPRVVDMNRWLWCPILHGYILRFRPGPVAAKYLSIWTEHGSPLMVHSRALEKALQARLGAIKVELAMTYGEPSIDGALEALARAGVDRVIVLPLFPQYSGTTTAAVFDRLARALKKRPWVPALRLITDYHLSPHYLDALERSVRDHWSRVGQPDKLLISFHGIPERLHRQGDPYPIQCKATAEALMERLGLDETAGGLTYQSRFGREPWLKPYTNETLRHLATEGARCVDVICPGFAVDCLETLEEIEVENRQVFVDSGGQELRYIPALNSGDDHVRVLSELVTEQGQGWPLFNSQGAEK